MAISIIVGIFLVLAVVGCGIWAYISFDDDNFKRMFIAGSLGVVSIIAFICVPFSIHTVDAGEIAVVKHLGQVKEVKTAGTYYNFWMTNQYLKLDSKVQDMAIETAAYSSDAQTMTVQMNIQYQILSDKALDIVNQYGTLNALTSRIQAIATEKTKSALSSHKAMDIIADRAAMSPAVEDAIRNAVGEEYYVNIVSVALTNIDFSDAFEIAVEEKMVAEQNLLKAQYENQTMLEQTEANAKAKVLVAEAEAEANKLLEQSLTDEILQEMYIEKWNGVLPSVVTGEDANIMLPTTK